MCLHVCLALLQTVSPSCPMPDYYIRFTHIPVPLCICGHKTTTTFLLIYLPHDQLHQLPHHSVDLHTILGVLQILGRTSHVVQEHCYCSISHNTFVCLLPSLLFVPYFPGAHALYHSMTFFLAFADSYLTCRYPPHLPRLPPPWFWRFRRYTVAYCCNIRRVAVPDAALQHLYLQYTIWPHACSPTWWTVYYPPIDRCYVLLPDITPPVTGFHHTNVARWWIVHTRLFPLQHVGWVVTDLVPQCVHHFLPSTMQPYCSCTRVATLQVVVLPYHIRVTARTPCAPPHHRATPHARRCGLRLRAYHYRCTHPHAPTFSPHGSLAPRGTVLLLCSGQAVRRLWFRRFAVTWVLRTTPTWHLPYLSPANQCRLVVRTGYPFLSLVKWSFFTWTLTLHLSRCGGTAPPPPGLF